MIGFLRGEVLAKEEDNLLLDVGGVGYVVFAPTNWLDLLTVGIQAQIFTHLHVREQELTLFGFRDKEELTMFRTLLKVQGIGAKVALAILSHISIEMLHQAIARQEAGLLTRIPGIGAKKAKQIVFQLKDAVGAEDVFGTTSPINDSDGEVIAALTTLGYSVVEAQMALQQLSKEARQESTEEKVRLALSSLARI